ncbi:MAG TPA: hypothetical protein VH439_17285 [Gemmatimonadales bacterium]
MRRPSYLRAVEWIALNDEPTLTDAAELSELISVVLVADLWGKEPDDVARDVLQARAEAHA